MQVVIVQPAPALMPYLGELDYEQYDLSCRDYGRRIPAFHRSGDMKQAQLRKELKNASVTVKLTTFSYSGDCAGLSAHVVIDFRNAALIHGILSLHAQATDFSRDETSTRKEASNCFRSFPGHSGFYALKCPVEMSYCTDWNDKTPMVASLFSLVRAERDRRNLHHVSPDCELTQFLAALECLGCSLLDVTVNGGSFYDWRQGMRARLEQAQATA